MVEFTEDFYRLMAVVITEAVRLNGGPIEVSREVFESFDPWANRISIMPDNLRDMIVITAHSGEIIEGEVVAD